MDLKTRQRIALSAFFFQTGIIFSTWASRIPDVKERFVLNDSELGTLLLMMPIGSFLGLPLAGWAVDRFGSKRSVGASTVAYALCLTSLAFADSIVLLSTALLLSGISGNLLNVAANTQGLAIQQRYGRVVMASFHGLWSLAGFCGAGLGLLAVALQLPMQVHFVGATVIVLLSSLYWFRFLNNDEVHSPSNGFSFSKPDNRMLQLGAVAFCGLLCEGCMFDWSGIYFKQVIGAKGGMVTVGFIAFMSMMATGRFLSDRITNRLGAHRVLQASGIFIGVGLLIAVAVPNIRTGILGFFLVGLGTSSVIPLTYNEVSKSTTLSPSKAIALVSTIGFFGFLLGPPLIGFIAEAINLRASFALVGLVGFVIALLVAYTKRKAVITL